jgi:excisionase family DNA binding protein
VDEQEDRLFEERLWKPEEIADRFRISRSKVYELLKSGELRSVRIGGSRRIPESGARDFLSSLR